MRLLIAVLDAAFAQEVRDRLYCNDALWRVCIVADGAAALERLRHGETDMLLLHACLPVTDGLSVLKALKDWRLCCPPRVLMICEHGLRRGVRVDCFAPPYASARRVCALLEVLRHKPVPALALDNDTALAREVERLLDALRMRRELKGYACAAWMLRRMAPSPLMERLPVGALYADCAAALGATPAAVERSLRVAVESVFTQGSLSGIERFFGATIDPERGKPTNRAFLIQAAQCVRLNYSCAAERLPNSMDRHHSPAAPTMV